MQSEKMMVRRNELFADLEDRATDIMQRHGLPNEQALKIADEIIDCLIDNWGGQYITIPKEINYRAAKRRAEICAEFNGNNHAELAKEHGLSVNTIYKILKRSGGQCIAPRNPQ